MNRAKLRPTDAEIIEVLTLHFRVVDEVVVEWLLSFAKRRMEIV